MTWKSMRIIHIYKSGCIKLKASITFFFSSLDWRGIWYKDVSQNLPMYFTSVSKCTNTNSSQLREKNTIHTHEISEYWHKSQTLWITFQSLTSLPCTLQYIWLWLMLDTDRQTDKKNTFSINLDEDSESIQKHVHYEHMYSSVALIIQFSVSPLVTHWTLKLLFNPLPPGSLSLRGRGRGMHPHQIPLSC